MRHIGILAFIGIVAAFPALAQTPSTTPVGPGRITCRGAGNCELTIGTPPSMRYKIDAASLPDNDKQRLVSACKPSDKPCIATVQASDVGANKPMKAASIKFYN
jgi:hypothetical protein